MTAYADWAISWHTPQLGHRFCSPTLNNSLEPIRKTTLRDDVAVWRSRFAVSLLCAAVTPNCRHPDESRGPQNWFRVLGIPTFVGMTILKKSNSRHSVQARPRRRPGEARHGTPLSTHESTAQSGIPARAIPLHCCAMKGDAFASSRGRNDGWEGV